MPIVPKIRQKIKVPEAVVIKDTSGKGGGLFAARDIKEGEIIFYFKGVIKSMAEASPDALQIGEDKFLESTEKFDDYLNHSCAPDGYIDFEKLALVAKRDIKAGEELSFNYNTSEYDLPNQARDCSFACGCGARDCLGVVRGFRYLTKRQKEDLKGYLSPYLQRKFREENV